MSRIIMNDIKNNKLIKFNNSYEFGFLELEDSLKYEHPVSNFYFKINDLSLNLLISLKWSIWAYIFLNETSKKIPEYENYLTFDKNIQGKDLLIKNNVKHKLTIDDLIVESEVHFIEIMENLYKEEIFDENVKVHFKLKINLNEFLLLKNLLTPTFLKMS